MSSTFNLSAKGWFAIGIIVCVLAAFAFGIAGFAFTHVHLVRHKVWLSCGPIELIVALILPFALIWHSVVRIRFAHDTIPVRKPFIQNPT